MQVGRGGWWGGEGQREEGRVRQGGRPRAALLLHGVLAGRAGWGARRVTVFGAVHQGAERRCRAESTGGREKEGNGEWGHWISPPPLLRPREGGMCVGGSTCAERGAQPNMMT